METVSYVKAGPDELVAAGESVGLLHRRCFSAPPWSETESDFTAFVGRFAQHMAEPALRGVLAYRGTEVVGLAYGWVTPARVWSSSIYDLIDEAVPASARPYFEPPALDQARPLGFGNHRILAHQRRFRLHTRKNRRGVPRVDGVPKVHLPVHDLLASMRASHGDSPG